MKHPLQSVLLTTVLTLPTVFGSVDQLPTSTDQTTADQSYIVKLSRRAFDLRDDPAAVARLYLGSLNNGSLLSDVSFVATQLEKLEYIASAIQAYERSKALPKTRIYTGFANTKIARLQQQLHTASNSDNTSLSTFRENLATSFNEALAVAVAANLWTIQMSDDECTALLAVINTHPTLTSAQKTILECLLPNATPYDIRCAANGLQDLGSQYHDSAAKLWQEFANRDGATQWDIQIAAEKLKALGTKYYPIAAELWQEFTNRDGATPDDIELAGNGFRNLGLIDRAIELFNRLTALPGETSEVMRFRAIGFSNLGSISPEGSAERTMNYAKAAELYELWANRDGATSDEIQMAAFGIIGLGFEYHSRAADLYKLLANRDGATPEDIELAGDGFRNLRLIDRAIELFNRLTTYTGETSEVMRIRAIGFKQLGSISPEGSAERTMNYEKAAELYELWANRDGATSVETKMAAVGIVGLGSEYYSRAAKLWKKSAEQHLKPKSQDYVLAAHGLHALAFRYPEGSAERTEYENSGDELFEKVKTSN